MTQSKIALVVIFAVCTLASAEQKEKKLQRSDLPPAVEKTVDAQSQGATINGFSLEKESGKTYYEAEMTVNGHRKDVLIDASGAIVEVEEQVDFDSLPAAVKDGLQSVAGKGKITKVETLTKHDKVVAYEAAVQTGSKRSELQVGPNGKPLNHPE